MTAHTKKQEAIREAKRQQRLRDLQNSNPNVKRRGQLGFTRAAEREATRRAGTPVERELQRRLFDGEPESNNCTAN